ncbi:MAG: zinc-dependent alcohol dehydrogenase [Anaerolineae bacterium]
MLTVRFLGQGRVALEEMPVPEPHGEQVLVHVRAAAICGTDRENLEGPGQETVPGHESAGEVAAVGRASRWKPGARVAINCHITCGACEHCLRGDLFFCPELTIVGFDIHGGFAEYTLVPEACCTPLPDDISCEVGALLVDMLGTAYRGVKRAGLLPGDRVAVWGAGPIGLSALLVMSRLGAEVAIADPNGYRREMAQTLGAALALDPGAEDVESILWDWTDGRGVDAAFECVGNERAAAQALRTVRNRGKMSFLGVSHRFAVNPWEDLIRRELTLYGSRSFVLSEWDEMISLVRRGLPVESIVTHRFPLQEAEAAFALFRTGQCGKVLLQP